MDDETNAPEIIWEGLGLVKFGIIPHWNNKKYQSKLETIRQQMHLHVTDTICLNDEQALIFIDGKWKVQ